MANSSVSMEDDAYRVETFFVMVSIVCLLFLATVMLQGFKHQYVEVQHWPAPRLRAPRRDDNTV